MLWLLLVPAYFLGTFPSAVWIARTKGIDITKEGSGNPGASNIARTLGTKWGLLVFLLDALKGALPAALGLITNHRGLGYAMVAASVVGHMFPATRQFRGGKGVATMGGSALVLQPIVSIILLAVWFGVRKLTKKASVASLTIAVGLPAGVAIKGAPGWEVAAVVGINVLVIIRHLDNIKRLVGGSELSANKRA